MTFVALDSVYEFYITLYLNNCGDPYFRMSPKRTTVTMILRYSLLSSRERLYFTKRTFCSVIVVCFYCFEPPPKWCTCSAVWLLNGWCHVKLLLSWRMFCVHHTTMYYLKCDFIRCHIRRVHVCLAVTCHLHFWQNDQYHLRATAVTEVERVPK